MLEGVGRTFAIMFCPVWRNYARERGANREIRDKPDDEQTTV